MRRKKRQNTRAVVLSVIVIAILLVICFSTNITKPINQQVLERSDTSIVAEESTHTTAKTTEPKKFIYLSDLDYITANNWSYNGWSGHNIQKDKNPEGGTIRVKIDGQEKLFLKGMGLHAAGQLTYDISSLSKQYSRFTAIVGVDASRTVTADLGITVSVSNDGNTWTPLFQRNHIRAGDEASKIDVNISNYTFLRIYVDPHSNNSSDHSVIANAKLVTADYNEAAESSNNYDKVHPLSYYDALLNEQTLEYNREHNYRLVLEREIVRKIGYEEIQAVAAIYPETKATLDWIFNTEDNSALEQCVAVGELRDGINFLKLLSDLYNEYKESLKTENGYVYQKMMVSMAASYTTDTIMTPLRFGVQYPTYDAVERFRLMKQLLDTNKFNNTNQFKSLPIELMRLVTNDGLRNDEYIWLNAYSATKGSDKFSYRSYVAYIDSANYNQDKFFNPIYKDSYSKMYKLEANGVPYGDDRTLRYWMVLDSGGVCWNISRMAQSVARVNGIPSTGIYSPVHEPYLFYTTNSSGKGIWEIRNKVGSWGVTGTTWGGGSRYRLPMDWANKYFTDQNISGSKGGTSAGYVVLAQANLNDYENYTQSVWYNLLANSYTDNQNKLKAYNKSLEIQPLNLDTYDNLINLYIAMGDEATNADWRTLANKIIDNYTFFPPASYDLIKVVNPHISDLQDRLVMDQKLLDSLNRANKATDRDTLQKSAVIELSAVLLGKVKVDLASFSFDGTNAGKIMIEEAYRDYDFELSYSLDGGKTYSTPTTSHAIQLSEEEILSITPANDIKLRMTGTDEVYTIDIIEHQWPTAVYGNDLENRIVDANLNMEWRLKNEDGTWPEKWTSYEEKSPDLTGNKVVQIRMRSMANKKFNSAVEFTFTQDNQTDSRRYIPVSHLNITGSGSQVNPAAYAINGNYNNYWRSGRGSNEKYLVISFAKPIYLSAVEFIPGPTNGKDGRFTKATVYNGANSNQKYAPWSNLTYATADNSVSDALRDKQIYEVGSTFTQKLSSVRITFSSADASVNLRGINFYQDLTKEPRPTAGIAYSTQEPTNGNVVARLVNKSSDSVRITNNNGSDTYTFTQNDTFTFEFIDDDTKKTGTATATVNWIDRDAPTATIEYDVTTATNGSVFATLKPSEDITVTSIDKYRENADGKVIDITGNVLEDLTIDEGGYVKDTSGNIVGNVSPFLHIFRQNDSYTFEFVDKAGNTGEATATVNWIDQDIPTARVTYDITTETEGNVVATLGNASEEITIINNDGKNTYTFTKNEVFTFEFVDKAGNKGTAKAEVTWIKTAEDKYQEVKAKAIQKIESYQSKVSKDEIENKKINVEEKSEVISAYDNLRDADKVKYTEFINRLKAGGKPIITKISAEPTKYKVGEEIELYSLITIKDNEDGEIVVNKENVKMTTNLNIDKAGTYDITYEVTDSDGNKTNLTIQVVIEGREQSEGNITSSEYEIKNNRIKKIPLDLEVNEFMKHIQANEEVFIKDKNQNILKGTSKIGTGMKAYVGKSVYAFVVKADVDGNGTVNLTDLAKICLHYIEEETLVNEYLEAADLDNNNKITITDLAKMQLLLVQK